MNFEEFLYEAKIKDMHAIVVGRMQPATLGHKSMVDTILKKKFKSVNIALSPSGGNPKNPLTVNDRKMQLRSVYKNVNVQGVETRLIFGMYLPDEDAEVRNIFKIKDNGPLVMVVGKEDDRFGAISKRSEFFVVNKNEEPTAKSPAGILGVDLKKLKLGDDEKISATTVRNAVHEGDDDTALRMMIGDDRVKEKLIKKIRKAGR